LNSKKVAAVITNPELSVYLKDVPLLIAKNPRIVYTYVTADEGVDSIHEAVAIYDCVTLGKNVSICADTVIGSPGISANRHNEKLLNIVHIVGVIIGDNVLIGANSVTACGNGQYNNRRLFTFTYNVSVGHNCTHCKDGKDRTHP
jgi:UDP-3-O-[3-hydroxymyristoyl] glucosamine N-acyltransferase